MNHCLSTHDDDDHGIVRHHHHHHQHDQGIGGHLAGQEVRAKQPLKASDTREVELKIEQLGGGKDTAISFAQQGLAALPSFYDH